MPRKKIAENAPNLSGVRIAAFREKAHLTQKELIDCINEDLQNENPGTEVTVSYTIISMWERGVRNVSSKYIPSLCRVLGCEKEDLLPTGGTLSKIVDDTVFNQSIPEINISNIENFENRPVYCVYKDLSYSNAWGLVDMDGQRIVTLKHIIPFADVGHGVKLYDGIPDYEVGSKRSMRAISYKTLKHMDTVYCISTSSDPIIRALYNGRYIHNEDKTCLINPWTGRSLPYEGYGISYVAYSDGTSNETVRNEVFYNVSEQKPNN